LWLARCAQRKKDAGRGLAQQGAIGKLAAVELPQAVQPMYTLMVYLPQGKILVNADLHSPPEPGVRPAPPTPGMKTLYQNMLKFKLDVAQQVPISGRVGTNEEFLKLVGGNIRPAGSH
jgi:hypothetical protein